MLDQFGQVGLTFVVHWRFEFLDFSLVPELTGCEYGLSFALQVVGTWSSCLARLALAVECVIGSLSSDTLSSSTPMDR